jgi:hypothetical protein
MQLQCPASARSASTSAFYMTASRTRSALGRAAARVVVVATADMTMESDVRPSVSTRAYRRRLLCWILYIDTRISSCQRVPGLLNTFPSIRGTAKGVSVLLDSSASRASRIHEVTLPRRLRRRICSGVSPLQGMKGAGRGDGWFQISMTLIMGQMRRTE